MGLFDLTRKVFLSPNCVSDESVKQHVLRALAEKKVPREKIVDGAELDSVADGDYLIRCVGDTLVVNQISLSREGFFTKVVGHL